MGANTLTGLNRTFPIKNSDGTSFHDLVLHKVAVDSVVMSLGDKITGDVYYRDNKLSVTMQEYVEYKGIRYVLINPPTIVREGMTSDNSDLRGMTKYSFEFYHPMCKLGNFPFTDIAVTEDQEQYLSQNKTFSWTGTGFDFIAKLNKNLQSTEWVVVTSDNVESIANLSKLPDEIPSDSGDKENSLVLSFDRQFVSDALKVAYDTWKVPFVIDALHEGEYFDDDDVDYYTQDKHFVIVFGLPSNEILDENNQPFIFQFGQGVGLKNNSRNPRNNKIITRIIPNGSTRNIPYGYPQIRWYGNQDWKYNDYEKTTCVSFLYFNMTIGNLDDEGVTGRRDALNAWVEAVRNNIYGAHQQDAQASSTSPYAYSWQVHAKGEYSTVFFVDAKYNLSYRVAATAGQYVDVDRMQPLADAYPIYKGIMGGQYVNLIKHPFTRTTLMPTVYYDRLFNKVSPYNSNGTKNESYDPTIELVDYYDAVTGYPNPINPEAPSAEIHSFDDIYPRFGDKTLVEVMAYDETVYTSLVDFERRMDELIAASNNENEKNALEEALSVVTFGAAGADYHAYQVGGSYTYKIDIVAYEYQGGFWYDFSYKSSTASYKCKPYDGEYSPAHYVVWDDSMKPDTDEYVQSYFKIKLPVLDFDLYACASITEEMSINMRDGACIGCTFQASIDWDVYKANFYKTGEDGKTLIFDPVIHTTDGDGHVRDGSLFPDSSQGQIELVVKKDLDTFGTLVPNTYQQPKTGDKFVILGISLPYSYITNAQDELEDAAKEYMLENNVFYYDYPLKFDEYFLANNLSILEQVRNNTIVRFKFGNEPTMALYIKQITVKYGDNPLPTYDITLTDDVEIVLNQIGQVTDDVSRMRVQMSELQKYYSENVVNEIRNKISRIADDVAEGRITFQKGLDAIGNIIIHDEIRSDNFETGLYEGHGFRIDSLGNAEFESIRARSFLEVVELLVNRMQAQEGDTVFSDNDQIDRVEKYIDPTDSSVSYVLSLKEKWAGYYTPQMYGNILKGIINTLAAKDAGVSDVQDSQTVEKDGSNSFFTSWMRVIATHNTDNTLSPNQIRVVLYGDDETPAGRNFEPCELMTMTRWGCINYSTSDASKYADEGLDTQDAIIASIKRRQQVFYISTSEGRIVKLTGVDSPILRNGNFGTTLGILPEFVQNYPTVHERMIAGRDYLYAQGVVVGDFIKIDVEGNPIPTVVDKGEWQNNTPYYYNKFNETTQQYETHRVRHNGGTWQCLQSQPVISGGVATYYEPKWNSPYWMLVDGNNNLTIEFVSSKGYSFRRGAVNTDITPHLFYGNVDISNDVAAEYWNWTRSSESGKTTADEAWDVKHTGLVTGIKTLHLTNNDMPQTWSSANKAIFTCTVSVNDGKTTRIVDNQIIS
jgi:hypothetical protein